MELARVLVATTGRAAAAGRAVHQAAGQAGPSLAISAAAWRRRRRVWSSAEAMPFASAPGGPTTCWLEAHSFKVVLVQRVLTPGSGPESWTLLGDDGEVVAPAERYLAYLAAIERSPNTVRAYAVSLKLWFEFLAWAKVGWEEVGIEDVARFVAWLRAPAPNVVVLADGAGVRRPATVNRYLAGVFGFYDHHARAGLGVAPELVAWRRTSRGSYKPFLHHVTKGKPIPVRPVKLHVPRQAPRTLAPEQIVAVLAATEHLRDRFLLSLLAETGMRVGQALGLRHSDFVSHKREVHIVPRADNANKARAKVRSAVVVPVSAPLVRLYSEYIHTEYGDVDSDYVFVNLFAGKVGHPMAYPAVHKLIGRAPTSCRTSGGRTPLHRRPGTRSRPSGRCHRPHRRNGPGPPPPRCRALGHHNPLPRVPHPYLSIAHGRPAGHATHATRLGPVLPGPNSPSPVRVRRTVLG